jgi:hypothetical protein
MKEKYFRWIIAFIFGAATRQIMDYFKCFNGNKTLLTIAGFIVGLLIWLSVMFIYSMFRKPDEDKLKDFR